MARYYFRRGAYLAAANRAQQAVQDFQQSPATEEALFIMMRCYDRMGLPQLKEDAQRVLARSYPESKFLTVGEQANSKSWWSLW
ncbi:outer membrane protein assembly factor BamD, partial [Salmonella sp. SAL4458]|uniref:outer membrane protein assembly factor BamD n=1 Tax=Salmonella sp. SAL4458 TaxID=3159913 RepID=UPI00397E24B8